MAPSISPWMGTIRRDGTRRQSADEERQLQLCQIMWALRHAALLVALVFALDDGALRGTEYTLVALLVVQIVSHLLVRATVLRPWHVTVIDFLVIVPSAWIGLPPTVVFVLGIAILSWAATLRAPTAIMSYLVVAASVGATAAKTPAVRESTTTWAFLVLGCIFMVRTIRLNMGARMTAERDKLVADRIDAVLWEQLPCEGVALKVSAAAERLLGYPSSTWAEPGFWLTIVHPDDLGAVALTLDGGNDRAITIRARHADGSWRWLESRASWASDRSGRPAFRVGVLLDRTDQVNTERSALTFGHLVASSPVGQLLLRCDDTAGPVIEAINRKCARLLNLDPSVVGRPLLDLVDEAVGVEHLIALAAQEHHETAPEIEFHGSGDRIYQATLRDIDETSCSIDFLEITERVKTSRRLHTQARQDDLTGLPNRRAFIEALETRLNDPAQPPTSLLVIDLDEFKEINDSLGHETGDRLLRNVGRRIFRRARSDDLVARLGGDEFAVILYDATPEIAMERAAGLVEAINQPISVGDLRLRVGSSVGVASYPDDAADGSELVRRADVAMYHAKTRGSSVQAYNEDIDHFGSDRLELVGDLEVALDRGELLLHHQPLIEVASGTVVGTEVLARWDHPRHGRIGPDLFIELAEVSGQMRSLTRWVLGQALRDLRTMQDAGIDLEVSVNLSVRNLYEPDLIDWLKAEIATVGVSPKALIVEITEYTIMDDQGAAIEMIQAMRDLGIRTWIDDFGTGHSSFARLRSLPVHGIKIDRSFLCEMEGSDADRLILKNIIDLAHSLGLSSIGEGVESAGCLRLLEELGCDYAQGFYMGHPAPLSDVLQALRPRAVVSATS